MGDSVAWPGSVIAARRRWSRPVRAQSPGSFWRLLLCLMAWLCHQCRNEAAMAARAVAESTDARAHASEARRRITYHLRDAMDAAEAPHHDDCGAGHGLGDALRAGSLRDLLRERLGLLATICCCRCCACRIGAAFELRRRRPGGFTPRPLSGHRAISRLSFVRPPAAAAAERPRCEDFVLLRAGRRRRRSCWLVAFCTGGDQGAHGAAKLTMTAAAPSDCRWMSRQTACSTTPACMAAAVPRPS